MQFVLNLMYAAFKKSGQRKKCCVSGSHSFRSTSIGDGRGQGAGRRGGDGKGGGGGGDGRGVGMGGKWRGEDSLLPPPPLPYQRCMKTVTYIHIPICLSLYNGNSAPPPTPPTIHESSVSFACSIVYS